MFSKDERKLEDIEVQIGLNYDSIKNVEIEYKYLSILRFENKFGLMQTLDQCVQMY